MKFEDCPYSQKLKYKKFDLSFGDIYFLENFIITEIKSGIHLDWGKVEELISLIFEYYGDNPKIGFMSNRVNSYSTEPESWIKLEKKYDIVVASAIISYNQIGFINANIEKKFSKKSIKRCKDLDSAIDWILNLKEFKESV